MKKKWYFLNYPNVFRTTHYFEDWWEILNWCGLMINVFFYDECVIFFCSVQWKKNSYALDITHGRTNKSKKKCGGSFFLRLWMCSLVFSTKNVVYTTENRLVYCHFAHFSDLSDDVINTTPYWQLSQYNVK